MSRIRDGATITELGFTLGTVMGSDIWAPVLMNYLIEKGYSENTAVYGTLGLCSVLMVSGFYAYSHFRDKDFRELSELIKKSKINGQIK